MKKATIIASILAIPFVIAAQTDAKDILNIVKENHAPDKRVAVWDIKTHNDGAKLVISGKVDKAETKTAIDKAFAKEGIEIIDNIELLPSKEVSEKPWALVKLPFAHHRIAPGHEHEMATQALMGTPLRLLEKKNGWYRVQTPDNYISWVIASSIKPITQKEFDEWRAAERYIVTELITFMYETPKESVNVVSDILLGDILVKKGEKKGWILLSTPDGRQGYAKASDVTPIEKWASQNFNPELMLNIAKRMMGSTYTWGGTSTKGVDCSGLTKTCYFANGIIIQRDASQQVLYGKKIAPEDWATAQPGDLLYFGNKNGRVTHTAIYEKDGYYIHSSGQVKRNSVDPENKAYLTTPFLSINRINGMVGTPGIVAAKNHKWYFNK